MVHLTDMHTTQFEQQQLDTFGAREADFRHFAQAVLKPVAPGALMITGDLVDAKTKLKRGLQNETEWQVRPSVGKVSMLAVVWKPHCTSSCRWHSAVEHRQIAPSKCGVRYRATVRLRAVITPMIMPLVHSVTAQEHLANFGA